MAQLWHKLCLCCAGYNHHIPVYFGPASSVHGVPHTGGTYPEETSLWTFTAHTE